MNPYTKKDPKTIENMFDNIAPQYDFANSLMSLNLHKGWNEKLAKTVLADGSPKRYLDICCGTGEIAFNLLKHVDYECEAFLLDFSEKMLDCAKAKAGTLPQKQHQMHYLRADAQQIPLPSDSIDAATIAYGIRNVQNPEKCIREVYRVLRKGASFAILELTQPNNQVLKFGHKLYMKAFLPMIGKYVTADRDAYQYLCGSIQEFLKPSDLENLLKKIGYQNTRIQPLTLGVATIIKGQK